MNEAEVVVEELDKPSEKLGIFGLYEVSGDAMFVGTFAIVFRGGGCVHKHNGVFELLMSAKFLKKLKAVHAWHIDIRNDNQRMLVVDTTRISARKNGFA